MTKDVEIDTLQALLTQSRVQEAAANRKASKIEKDLLIAEREVRRLDTENIKLRKENKELQSTLASLGKIYVSKP